MAVYRLRTLRTQPRTRRVLYGAACHVSSVARCQLVHTPCTLVQHSACTRVIEASEALKKASFRQAPCSHLTYKLGIP
jgi:hypothetical protein